MSAGKIILLIFGIIVLLISVGLLAGGGALVWADWRYVDRDGFLTTDTLHIERDSHAIVAGPIEIDETALKVLRNIGVVTIFEFEGRNNNPSKPIFMGIADERDLDSYLNNINYDEITSIDFGWHLDFDDVRYINRSGTSTPSVPASENIWAESVDGIATETLRWETEAGSYSIVMMNGDGSSGVDIDVVFKVKVPSIIGWAAGLLIGGAVVLFLGIMMIYFAARRPRTLPAAPPDVPSEPPAAVISEPPVVPVSTVEEGEIVKEEPDVTSKAEPDVKAVAKDKTSIGLDPNVAGLLCYVLGWLSGIIIFILERDNQYVRFHALQSIIVFGALNIAISLLTWIPIIGGFFGAVFGITIFILWIVLMVKAYQGEKFKIPWAGDFAEKQVS